MAMTMEENLQKLIESEAVILFMKGTPDFPQCGFSAQLVQLLSHLDVEFTGVNVLENESLRQSIKSFSDWPTIPQLYIKGEFIGGCDIVRDMFEKNELKPLLEEKGVLNSAT